MQTVNRIAVLCFIVAFLWSVPALAADELGSETLVALDHARLLYQEGDLFRAVGEAKRFLFFHPQHPRAGEARALLERAQKELEQKQPGSDNRAFSPRPESRPASAPYPKAEPGPAVKLVEFYQKHLRTFRNPNSYCPSFPNCSNYAVQAIEKHGALLGFFIYVDRFLREVTTAGRPPLVRHEGRLLHYDPLEYNDYWLGATREDR
ncbi:MAG: membrane protein insertion efficiency factor YidD [Pseudomonadota bacterium]